jgi:hypothetical protein
MTTFFNQSESRLSVFICLCQPACLHLAAGTGGRTVQGTAVQVWRNLFFSEVSQDRNNLKPFSE